MQADAWKPVSADSSSTSEFARKLGVPKAIARLLEVRGVDSVAAARIFLYPSIDHLHDPSLMLGITAAVHRLRAALAGGEPILIYGDYDVDGTVATVLLKTAAERAAAALGVTADVRYHIPHRIREGYGMQETRIEEAAAEGIRLVISVDTGIRAFRAAEQAKRVGLDLIVTDHHLPDASQGVPEALAVINPNQPGCSYPFKELCGAGVAYKLAQALLENVLPPEKIAMLREKTLPSFLKLLAVATIADAVPLKDENRAIVALGLQQLRQPSQGGLRALLDLAQIDTTRPIAAGDIGFRLAPRINAAGRMDVASDVVDMFLTKDLELARTLAEKLHRLNEERRTAEAEALRAIEAQMDELATSEAGLPPCLVLDDATTETQAWHRGVIGILASRVVDRTGRPALVITHEDGVAYGSGRSVSGFHLLDALTAAHATESGPLLTRFGGHAHAVGFALPSDRVLLLRQRMESIASEGGFIATNPTELEYDSEISLSEITKDFLSAVETLGPFGMANEEPVFVSRDVRMSRPPVPIKERHLRVAFEDIEGEGRLGGMAWGRRVNWAERAQTEGWMQGDRMDVAYRLRENTHPDFGGWEMEILGLRRTQ